MGVFFVNENKYEIKVHILHCGSILVSDAVPYGGGVTLKNAAHGVFEKSAVRTELPVSAYLIEHPKGLVLVDTGWSREISPDGRFDAKASNALLPSYLTGFYHPWVEKGKTVAEQLDAMGIKPEDLHTVLLTHLDADHTCGLKSLKGAPRFLVSQEEYWWTCRTAYKARQPKKLWEGVDLETFWFKGTGIGPLWWSYDLFDDGSINLVCLPGHTDGQVAVKIENNGKFIILASDAAFSARSYEEMLLPGFGFNDVAMKKSLKWLKEESEKPECMGIFANHDPSVEPQTIIL